MSSLGSERQMVAGCNFAIEHYDPIAVYAPLNVLFDIVPLRRRVNDVVAS